MASIVPDYSAHPLLHPAVSEVDPSVFRMLYKQYLEIIEGEEGAYNDFLNRLLRPSGEQQPLESNLETVRYYLNETMQYTKGVAELMPAEVRESIATIPEVRDSSDLLELLTMIFASSDRRLRFEAQRKLYLSKLLFDVDHCREVLDGTSHKTYFESLIARRILSNVTKEERIEVSFSLAPDRVHVRYRIGEGSEPGDGSERWSLDLREVQLLHQGWPIRLHVYFYSCRFKKEVIGYQYQRGEARYALEPTEIWGNLSRRKNGSIISKMIRKGENDPRLIKDLIGAMFIVKNLMEVEHLKEVLVDIFGGPFRVKNIVDTLTGDGQQGRLNRYSGSGYKVFKCEIDVLYRPPGDPDAEAYFFPVEVQIYTLETYLRTIHADHYASHQALKKRQFLLGLVPYLFPASIYGEEPIARCAALAAG
jgi:hypothetical protein